MAENSYPDLKIRALQGLVRELYARMYEVDRLGFEKIRTGVAAQVDEASGYTITRSQMALLDDAAQH